MAVLSCPADNPTVKVEDLIVKLYSVFLSVYVCTWGATPKIPQSHTGCRVDNNETIIAIYTGYLSPS